MHSLGFYHSSMVTCRYSIPESFSVGPGEESELQAKLEQKVELAIAKVVLDHPSLRVGLRGEHERKPVFVELEAVDFRRHIEWRRFDKATDYESEFLVLIRSRLNIKVPQPEDTPSWRILVLRVEGERVLDVMFEWGHAHIDGMSAKMFHEDLLRNLNGDFALQEFKNRILTIPPYKRRDLPPSLHALTKFPITPGYALATLWDELRSPRLLEDSKSDLHATWAPIRLQPYVTQYRHFSIDGEGLRNVLAACRKHNTTLTGLIQSVVHVSLATRLSAEDARGFLGCTIMNLRPLMCALGAKSKVLTSSGIDPKKTMGNFVTLLDHEFDARWVARIRTANVPQVEHSEVDVRDGIEGEKVPERRIVALEPLVWEMAERTRTAIQKRLDDGTKNDIMGLMKFIPDYRALLKEWAKKPRGHSAAVTNLGVIDGHSHIGVSGDIGTTAEAGGKWTIERAVFSISPEAHGTALCICPIAVKDRELYVSCDWQDCAVDTALGEGVIADLESWLRFLGRNA
ncbi:uncharacterized protein GGS22DRAFT_101136 [Annulohypoxylon maeteangense]|uniref:uncharacterized protein n=1 Tax=Annulohypoxylon maeteangense TaxID=1927788 RepID=UPI0020078CC1|nr:uncharacterized protein GGS22DRAFT_101136 [Annulohypoxylon maeteangense]KAI0879992.1 hypothetical protein GGS22DRAFT_101136 [Annulohypoxylon maeteangense]